MEEDEKDGEREGRKGGKKEQKIDYILHRRPPPHATTREHNLGDFGENLITSEMWRDAKNIEYSICYLGKGQITLEGSTKLGTM